MLKRLFKTQDRGNYAVIVVSQAKSTKPKIMTRTRHYEVMDHAEVTSPKRTSLLVEKAPITAK